MKIGRYEITWGERSESVFAFIQISNPDWIRAFFAIWLYDGLEFPFGKTASLTNGKSVVTLYVEIFFIKFKALKIYP